MKRITVKELGTGTCADEISARMKEKRISFQINEAEQWVQVDACGPCAERLQKEGKEIEGCEKCVGMTLDIIQTLGYEGSLVCENRAKA